MSCGKLTPPVETLEGANKKFKDICDLEYGLTVQLRLKDNTMYVYLPVEHELVDLKHTAVGKISSSQATVKPVLKFISTAYSVQNFIINYDVAVERSYPNNPGYTTQYTEESTAKQVNILRAIYAAYGDLDAERAPGDIEFRHIPKDEKHKAVARYRPKEHPPEFFVITIADIKSGIKMTQTFHYLDFKQSMTEAMPQEEFMKRRLSELTGNPAIVDDKAGKHIDHVATKWPDFIARQIEHRVTFKYSQSSIPPAEDPADEVLNAVKDATRAYNFNDFGAVKLVILPEGKERLIGRAELH